MQWVITSEQVAKVLKQSIVGGEYFFSLRCQGSISRGQISRSTAFSVCESGRVKLGLEKAQLLWKTASAEKVRKGCGKCAYLNKGLVA